MTTEQRLPHEEVFFSPPITAQELLGREILDLPKLPLATAAIRIAAKRSGKITEYAAVIDTRIDSRTFFPFLERLAPGDTRDDTPSAIIEDWGGPDEDGVDMQQLMDKHGEALGKSWEDFMGRRNNFIKVMSPPEGYQFDEGGYPYFYGRRISFAEFLEPRDVHVGIERDPLVCINVIPEGYTGDVYEYYLPQKGKLASVAIHNLPESPSGDNMRLESTTFTLDGNYSSHEGYDLFDPNRDSLVLRDPYFFIPELHWQTTDDGERQWFSETAAGSLAAGLHARSEQSGGEKAISDTLIGLLAVTFFSQDDLREWPERMPLPNVRAQDMGVGQTPVLVHILRGQLLSSPFIAAAERHPKAA